MFKTKILAACSSIEHNRFGSALLNVQAAKKAAESVREDHDASRLKQMLVGWLDAQSGFEGAPMAPDPVERERIEQEAEFLRGCYDN